METAKLVERKKKKSQSTTKPYNNEDLANAIQAINDGRMSFSKASAKFKVPQSTIWRKIHLGETTIQTPGRKPRTWIATLEKDVDPHKEEEKILENQNLANASESVKLEQIPTITEMELGNTIKKEMEWCIACMHESDLSSTPELVSTYKELLGKNVDDEIYPKFCSACSSFLQDVQNFKMACLNSFSRLFESVFAEPLKYEETVLQVEDIVSEEVNDDHHFENEVCEKKLTKIKTKKRLVKKKLAVPKKKALQSRITMLKQETDHCNICQIKVSSFMPHILSEHMTVLDQTTSNCNICDKKILASLTRKHFSTHNNRFDEPKACATCGKQFLEVYRYRKHQDTHVSLECDHCGKVIESKFRMKSHILTQHMSVKCCYHCKEFFYNAEEYKAHLAAEKKIRPIARKVCDICGFEAINRTSLRSHRIAKHLAKPATCDKCGKTLKSALRLAEHYKLMHDEPTYECEYCGKRLSTKGRLVAHIENLHEPRYVDCDICGKVLRPKTLKNHRDVIHSNVYKFACKICGRAFKQELALKKHYFSHVKKRPFNCHLCTDTGYYMTDYLKKHYQRIHGLNYTTQEVRGVMRKVVLDEEQMVADQIDEDGTS